MAKVFSRESLNFIVHEVLQLHRLTAHAMFCDFDKETADNVLDAATDLSEKFLLPFYRETPEHEPQLKDGVLSVHPAIKTFMEEFANSGFLSASFPKEWGGQQMPRLLTSAAHLLFAASNNSFLMFPDLLSGVARLILYFGSASQQQEYLPKLLAGQWGGTMCLTEPEAGSSLADIRAKAVRIDDDRYKIQGEKIFISAGDQNVTENIVHMVLARAEGSPAGIKGISLFIVPKKIMKNGKLTGNGVVTESIFHKMGQTASPAVHLTFGQGTTCEGFLLGELNKGLQYMFQMMNNARLGTGLGGSVIASHAYYISLDYARQRVQGKINGSAVPIIKHADVRRMLLAQRSFVEGTFCLGLYCYRLMDQIDINDDPKSKILLDLLTPVVKAYGSEGGNRSVYNAMQVMGGIGYTKDMAIEQLYRDVRISSIYEGTTAIQSIALLGRFLNEESIRLWCDEVFSAIVSARKYDDIKSFADELENFVLTWRATTATLLKLKEENLNEFLADATVFMDYFGTLNLGWHWLWMAAATRNSLTPEEGGASTPGSSAEFYASVILTMKYFFKYELTKCLSFDRQLKSELAITIKDIEGLIM